jgi:Uma2 family endonuclease
MVQTSGQSETVSLSVPRTVSLSVTHAEFETLASVNQDLKLERTAQGGLIVNPPTGWETGERNWNISGELYLWWRNAGEPGKAFDSSTGFILPNGATRSPDASWVSQPRWDALSLAQRKTFAQICPDFVVELRSASDALSDLRAKMLEYIDNGAKLGWLIDPAHRQVEVYRLGETVQVLDHPSTLSGEAVLPGFLLDLTRVWS